MRPITTITITHYGKIQREQLKNVYFYRRIVLQQRKARITIYKRSELWTAALIFIDRPNFGRELRPLFKNFQNNCALY